MVLLIVACLAGMFLGLYYNFLVLIPLTLAAAITCSAAAALHGQTISASLLAIIVPAVGLQGGYMIGLTSRDLLSQFVSRLNGVQSKRI
ncbi:MAG: hypothetical protein ACLQDM_10490 [Bradyrhizobium sp.]